MGNQPSLFLEDIGATDSSSGLEDDLADVLRDEDIHTLRKHLFLDSVRSAFGISRGGRPFKPSDEAWAWINESSDSPFSFEQCCRELAADPDLDFAGLDPENLRSLLRWNRRRMLGRNN